jgi:hypothetical protein
MKRQARGMKSAEIRFEIYQTSLQWVKPTMYSNDVLLGSRLNMFKWGLFFCGGERSEASVKAAKRFDAAEKSAPFEHIQPAGSIIGQTDRSSTTCRLQTGVAGGMDKVITDR